LTKPEVERLDIELVLANLARSRNHAHQLIAEGRVLVDGKPALKPAQRIAPGQELSLTEGADYVSRAGQKLKHALDSFGISVSGVVLDAGAAAGGFTQVLLGAGAQRVVAIDVGSNQLAESLRSDARVTSLEGVNLRYLDVAGLAELVGEQLEFSLVVADLSFISLTLVLPQLSELAPEADMVLLIKPQFEVGRESLKAGIVTDAPERERAIRQVVSAASELGYSICGLIESPTTGSHGNVEYLLWISRTGVNNQAEWQQAIADRARRIK
jgi:23S rRNA (cytidine1920-2'-O)/16S rRNA (cytidine1409-2'-O)-methyltransferase